MARDQEYVDTGIVRLCNLNHPFPSNRVCLKNGQCSACSYATAYEANLQKILAFRPRRRNLKDRATALRIIMGDSIIAGDTKGRDWKCVLNDVPTIRAFVGLVLGGYNPLRALEEVERHSLLDALSGCLESAQKEKERPFRDAMAIDKTEGKRPRSRHRRNRRHRMR